VFDEVGRAEKPLAVWRESNSYHSSERQAVNHSHEKEVSFKAHRTFSISILDWEHCALIPESNRKLIWTGGGFQSIGLGAGSEFECVTPVTHPTTVTPYRRRYLSGEVTRLDSLNPRHTFPSIESFRGLNCLSFTGRDSLHQPQGGWRRRSRVWKVMTALDESDLAQL
jgi:hypothetical protein